MGNYQNMQATNNGVHGVNLKLLNAAIRFNALMLGLTAGTLAAVVMYIATHASIAKWGTGLWKLSGSAWHFFSGILCQ